MRTSSHWLYRRAQQSLTCSVPGAAFHRSNLRHVAVHSARLRSCHRPFATCDISFPRRLIHTDTVEPSTFPPSNRLTDKVTDQIADDLRQPQDPDDTPAWTRRLNKHLPGNLQILPEHSPSEVDGHAPAPLDARRLDKIFAQAKSQHVSNILHWLVDHGHRRTAVWLMKTILDFPTANRKPSIPTVPSNIAWPDDIFKHVRFFPIREAPTFRATESTVHDESLFESARFENRSQQAESRLLGRVWETLGSLVIKSANADVSHVIDDNLLTVLLVLSHVHNLGMMPNDVYAYDHSNRPTYLQRPPILNLVSSRILTAISDAAWREQQDEAIFEAARKGMSLKEISQDVPGGRFRLKVRPLGPEIWLELILWSCIELNQTSAALAIVSNLAAQVEEPWFAFRWTSRERLTSLIDWNRTRSRRDEPLIEGYSREKPLVDVPEKTVSVEVILALLDRIAASVLSSSLVNTSKMNAFTIHKDFRGLRKTMADIETVMTFLEPHDLPANFFDFLETRLLHDAAFDTSRTPVDLYNWTVRMKTIRDLQTVSKERPPRSSLELGDILAQSQVHAGVQQQAMNVLMEFGDVHHALTLFNEIQEGVDKKKVESITSFLEQQPETKAQVPTSSSKYDLEFTNSHGQLPHHQLAGFLNLISDTKLTGLGRWLLYAEDVDGALIPQSIWGSHSMTSALYKFAAVSQDEKLLAMAQEERAKNYYRPSVRMLRTLANTNMSLLRMDLAHSTLEELVTSQAGGFGLSNVVYLAAAILRLEQSQTDSGESQLMTRSAAINMLWQMVVYNRYDFKDSAFGLHVRQLFLQQIRHTLSVFEMFEGSVLRGFARANARKYPFSNLPSLPAKEFNVLLAAAADVYGAAFARKMWDRYCRTPDSPYAIERFEADVDDLDENASGKLDINDDINESESTPEFDVSLNDSSEDVAYFSSEGNSPISSAVGVASESRPAAQRSGEPFDAVSDGVSPENTLESSSYAIGSSTSEASASTSDEMVFQDPYFGNMSPLSDDLRDLSSEHAKDQADAPSDAYAKEASWSTKDTPGFATGQTMQGRIDTEPRHDAVDHPDTMSGKKFKPAFLEHTEGLEQAGPEHQIPLPTSEEISTSPWSEDDRLSSQGTHVHGEAPVTVPNLNTLRIIIRAVTVELKERQAAGQAVKQQVQQLAWAVEMFKAFGIVDRDVVEQEIQYPLHEIDAQIIEESKDIISIARSFESYNPMADVQDLRVGAPTSSMWIPFTARDLEESRIVSNDI